MAAMQYVVDALSEFDAGGKLDPSYGGMKRGAGSGAHGITEGSITINIDVRPAEGMPRRLEVPVQVKNGHMLQPSIVYNQGTPYVMCQASLDDIMAGAEVKQSVQVDRENMYSLPKTAQSFSFEDLFDHFEPSDKPGKEAPPPLEQGEEFQVEGSRGLWVVTQAYGASGYCRKAEAKKKWFGYLHDRDTDSIEIYPVTQGSGDRSGDNLAQGKVIRVKSPKTAQLEESADFHKIAPPEKEAPGKSSGKAQEHKYYMKVYGPEWAEKATCPSCRKEGALCASCKTAQTQASSVSCEPDSETDRRADHLDPAERKRAMLRQWFIK